ncbi:MAG TPA: DeoR/GlpR transcriptional regulator [Spirochaetales bacterium]|nr:DeoR/GlpR transcriptional regulator [Spirochaetales bacterium]
MKILLQNQTVQVIDLARNLEVSKVTIRTDLDELENRGLLVRTYGGAVLPEQQNQRRHIANTIKEFAPQKTAIAKKAASFVRQGQNIIIDNGSTTVHMSQFLQDFPITVTTSSLLVMQELMHCEKIDLIMAGGILRRPSMGLMGNISKDFYRQIHADWFFLGASGYTVAQGVFCSNLIEADTKKSMIQSADKICLLVDSSKMEHTSLARVCDWGSVDMLITDTIHADVQSKIEEAGVTVIVTESE